jgi:acetyltransferase, GNAT family
MSGKDKFMNIRRGKIQDLKEITAIEAECFPVSEAATEELFKGRLTVYPDYFWILEEDGKIVSFVNGMVTDIPNLSDEMYENPHLHNPEGEWQMVFGVNTLPDYRKRGYAEKLLNEMIKDAKDKKRKGVVLTCKDALVHYYSKFGFKNEGVSESTHGGVVWYEMRLVF